MRISFRAVRDYPLCLKEHLQPENIAMKYAARNQLAGTVKSVKRGNVMSQVDLEVSVPASMSSVMTVTSLDEAGIKEGDTVRVVVKAVNVLLVKE